MTIRLNGQTSGYVELEAPATAGSNTLVLPTNNGTSGQYLQTNGSGALSWQTVASLSNAEDGTGTNFEFNSGFGSNGVAYGVRAWVNFLGTGTVTIRDSGNVSSITDNGTGDYDVNFTTAMPDDDYCVFGSCVGSTIPGYLSAIYPSGDTIATSDFRFRVLNYGGSYYDLDMISVAVIR